MELYQFCDPQVLIFALRDGARVRENGKLAEDLDGCPLALTADGKVRHVKKNANVRCCYVFLVKYFKHVDGGKHSHHTIMMDRSVGSLQQ